MSDLARRLNQDLATAIKERQETERTVLRSLTAALKNEQIASGRELDDAAVLAVVTKQVKQREESVAAYASRPELAQQEAAEAEVLKRYLPEQLDDAALDQLVEEAISETGASGMADMGTVMGVLKPKVAGRADGGAVAAKVKAKLG